MIVKAVRYIVLGSMILVINDYLFNDLQFTVCFSPQVSLRL